MGIVGVLLPDLHPRIVGEKTKDPIRAEHKTMRGHGREKVESDSN